MIGRLMCWIGLHDLWGTPIKGKYQDGTENLDSTGTPGGGPEPGADGLSMHRLSGGTPLCSAGIRPPPVPQELLEDSVFYTWMMIRKAHEAETGILGEPPCECTPCQFVRGEEDRGQVREGQKGLRAALRRLWHRCFKCPPMWVTDPHGKPLWTATEYECPCGMTVRRDSR